MGSVGDQDRGIKILCCTRQCVLYSATCSKKLGSLGLEISHEKHT